MITNTDFARERRCKPPGIRYVLGAKWGGGVAALALDCSGLVTAVGQRLTSASAGVPRQPTTSGRTAPATAGTRTAEEAANTVPVLPHRRDRHEPRRDHAGENKTMEAHSSHTSPQVGVFGAMTARRWTGFTTIPGVTYRGHR